MIAMPVRDDDKIQALEVNFQGFDVMSESFGIIPGVEENPPPAVLKQGCEAPILLQRGRLTESIVEDRDAVLRLGVGYIWQQQENGCSDQDGQCQVSHFVAFPLKKTYA